MVLAILPGTSHLWLFVVGHLVALLLGPSLLAGFLAVNVMLACLCVRRGIIGLLLCWLLGLCWGGGWVAQALQARPAAEPVDALLTVRVDAVRAFDSGRQLQVRVLAREPADLGVRQVRLGLYQPLQIHPGEVWQLSVRLRQPRGGANPGGPDVERALLRQRIDAIGYVRDAADNRRLHAAAGGWRPLEALRAHLAQVLDADVADPDGSRVLQALLLGERAALHPQDWEVLRRTGTTHLLIVSGLHVGLIAGFVWGLLVACGMSARWPLFTAMVIVLVAAIYALLTGFDLPARRALIMLVVACGCLVLGRRRSPLLALGLAAVIMLLIDPLAPLASGFWLSFIVVAGLLCLSVGRVGAGSGRLALLLRTQVAAAWVLMAPLGWFFGQMPLLSPLINLLAVPLAGGLLLPAGWLLLLSALAGVPGSPWALNLLADWSGAGFRGLASIPPMDLALVPVSLPVLVLAVLLALVTLSPLPWSLRMPAVIVLMALLVPASRALPEGEVEVVVLDVGQGHAAIVRTRDHALVFDTGPAPGAGALRAGLARLGVSELDRIVISHAHADHARGLQALRERFPGARVSSATAMVGSHEACFRGQHWNWNGVEFRVMAPAMGQAGDRRWFNRHSCVLSVRTARHRLLLPGDIDHFVERRLAARLQAKTLVVAPHHGSRTSSAPVLVERTQPRWVIVPAAWPSPFGHPHVSVVSRWQQAGARVLVTGGTGAVSWRSDREGLRCERDRRRRYWHWQPDESASARSGTGNCGRRTGVHEPGGNE